MTNYLIYLLKGLHSASITGITALDIKSNDSNRIVTGGNDKTAVVFNNSTEQIVATLKGHTKKLTSVIYHPDEVYLNLFSELIFFLAKNEFKFLINELKFNNLLNHLS
jgi:WD40 repeat protein